MHTHMVVVLTRPRIASHDRDRTTWRVLPFAFSHCMQRTPCPFSLTSSHIGNATIHRVSAYAKSRATRKRRWILASAADFVVGLDAQLSLRFAHRVHSLLYVPTRVPRPAHHLDEPVRDRPAVEADVADAGGVAEVADGAGEEGVSGDGLDGDDEAFALGVSVGGAEALADGESLKG